MIVKPVAEKFAAAVKELEDIAGEDELLKKKLNDWVSANFRMYEFSSRITTGDRLRARFDELMKHRTNQIVQTTMQNMSHTGDLVLVTVQTPEKEIDLRCSIICFAAGNVPNEDEPTDVA